MRLKYYGSFCHQIHNICKNCIHLAPQNRALVSSFRAFSQWDIVGAVCLERKPILSQDLSSLERKYQQYIQKLETEKSFLSDHEKRQTEEKRIADKLKAGLLEDSEAISKQTAQDFEDACAEELSKYQPASRRTAADASNARHSPQRLLDSSLVLVIRQKLGNDCKWVLPQAVHKAGETLRQTAERALSELTTYQSIQFMGNAPVGYYKYKYPKMVRGNGICGAKVFFFKAQLLSYQEDALSLQTGTSASEHLWLTHTELRDSLQPVLLKTVQSFLYPDTPSMEDSAAEEEEERTSFVASQ